MEKDKKQSQQLKIEIDEKIGQGDYVNFAVVTHSLAECILDFFRVLPGVPKSNVKSNAVSCLLKYLGIKLVLSFLKSLILSKGIVTGVVPKVCSSGTTEPLPSVIGTPFSARIVL